MKHKASPSPQLGLDQITRAWMRPQSRTQQSGVGWEGARGR